MRRRSIALKAHPSTPLRPGTSRRLKPAPTELDAFTQVNLPKAYCPGQAYVALSRATSLGSMRIAGLGPNVIYASEEALAFYARIRRAKLQGGPGRGR